MHENLSQIGAVNRQKNAYHDLAKFVNLWSYDYEIGLLSKKVALPRAASSAGSSPPLSLGHAWSRSTAPSASSFQIQDFRPSFPLRVPDFHRLAPIFWPPVPACRGWRSRRRRHSRRLIRSSRPRRGPPLRSELLTNKKYLNISNLRS